MKQIGYSISTNLAAISILAEGAKEGAEWSYFNDSPEQSIAAIQTITRLLSGNLQDTGIDFRRADAGHFLLPRDEKTIKANVAFLILHTAKLAEDLGLLSEIYLDVAEAQQSFTPSAEKGLTTTAKEFFASVDRQRIGRTIRGKQGIVNCQVPDCKECGKSNVMEFPGKGRKASDVIGLSGFAQVGKDTLGQFLVESRGFTRIAFADPLRDALYELNPIITRSALAIYPDVRSVVDEYGWEIAKKEFSEVRRHLQILGDVWRNTFGKNVLIDFADRKAQGCDRVVFTDVRTADEADYVRSKGGLVYQILRDDVKGANDHSTEKPLLADSIDRIILNNGTVESMFSQYERLENYAIAS